MEKYKPMPMPMHAPMPLPAVSPTSMGPASKPMPMPMPSYTAPINIHASYEEVNIYEPKKHHGHCHGGWYTSVGAILVLYILLVIILRGTGLGPAACK
ncbi:hypothetical protein ACHHV8_01855 [Paenibacillus sp. TAB 01]|uniref:hypothetical protein n=1 Tax=Paenibacillus sp. TAB 01 TaxID=3368988 RepID=UPI0037539C37